MVGINDLKFMNYTTIVFLEEIKQSTRRNMIINKILKDDACFFKMSKQDAYEVLEQIGINKSRVGKVYLDLVSEQSFYKLKKDGKIKDSENLVFDNQTENKIFYNGIDNSGRSNNEIKKNQLIEYKESKLRRIINKLFDLFKR
ncbi:MAG: hypothetical protein IJH12_06305 [Clostridia bacterium]|nr:hypothetical protein [Clostridia bacterium]